MASEEVMENYVDDMDEYCSIVDDFGCVAYEETTPEEAEKARRIRVQGDTDECLADVVCQEDLLHKIQQVRQTQSEYGRSDLYERQWRENEVDHDWNNMPVNGEAGTQSSFSITVMQFNTLAEGLSSGPSVRTPFQCDSANAKDKDRNNYGGFTEIKHPEVALDFTKRRWRLLEVLLGSCVSKKQKAQPPFDIIAMEEVDRYRGFFAPALKSFGYQGIFVPKIRAPGVNLGWYSDGCALFWKDSVFELVSERHSSYRVGTQVFILATLRHRQTGRHLVLAVTHLKARNIASHEEIRCAQVSELLERLETERQKLEDNVPVMILGDFNSEPPAASNQEGSCVGTVMNHGQAFAGNLDFTSAYPPRPGYFTTWKTRGTETVKRVIDYIFYANGKCAATLDVPDESEVEADQLPGLRYPSDHLAIAAKFDF